MPLVLEDAPAELLGEAVARREVVDLAELLLVEELWGGGACERVWSVVCVLVVVVAEAVAVLVVVVVSFIGNTIGG